MSPLVAIKFLMWPSVENTCSPLLQIMVLYMAIDMYDSSVSVK